MMKKILTILLVGVACFALSSCGANSSADENVKKGDGSKWYQEFCIVSGQYYPLTHSTLDCPAIKNGVRIDRDRRDTYFCTKCVDEELIDKWYKSRERR